MTTLTPDRILEFQRRLADEVHESGDLFQELCAQKKDLLRILAWRYIGRERAWKLVVRARKRPEGILITSKEPIPICGWFFLVKANHGWRVFSCEEHIDVHSVAPVPRVCELLPGRVSRTYAPLAEMTEKAFLVIVGKIIAGEIKPYLSQISPTEPAETEAPKKRVVRRKPRSLVPKWNRQQPVSYEFTKSGFARVVRLAELAGKLKERQRTYAPEHRKNLDALIKLVSDFKFQLLRCPGSETPLRKRYGHHVENLAKKDYWIYFRSPQWTWKNLCGRAGWYVIDGQNLKIKAFIKTVMN